MLDLIRQSASDQGFVLCGIAPAVDSKGYADLVRWIESGYAAEMDYFKNRQDAYRHPSGVLPSAKSIVVLAYPYSAAQSGTAAQGHGRVARYVWSGIDYHDVIHPKLKSIARTLKADCPDANFRGIVDTAPLMEREFAQLAGLGWRGKNTLLLNKQLGSYFFLACLLTDLDLPADMPHESAHCGTCTACLDACPTDAFPAPNVLDASKCISYLTIEHRGPMPVELREGIGDWLFGCDVCQEVCPWNRKSTKKAAMPETEFESLSLKELFEIDDDEFRARFRKTPLWRTRRRGVLRNAAIVLGNQRDTSAIEALAKGLQDDEPVVRSASAWALGRIGNETCVRLLNQRRQQEADQDVLREIVDAMKPQNLS